MKNLIRFGLISLLIFFVFHSSYAAYNFSESLPQSPNYSNNTPAQDKNLERAALRLYKKALRHFEGAAFWKATREFIVLLDFYENFSEIDGVLFYLGKSLYEMNMLRSGEKVLKYLMTNYPESDYLPQALLGLQQIYYNLQDFDESLKFYLGITTRFRDDKVLDGAYYYGGMAFFHQKKYDNAIKALSKIRSRSDYFDYGLYTVALAFLKKKISLNPSKPFAN